MMSRSHCPDQRSAKCSLSNCSEKCYEDLRCWVYDYVHNMDSTDANCRYQFDFKLAHSMRVVEETITIGHMLKLDASDMLTAKIIALLHDLGRFEQYKTYGTYNDRLSLDHGDLAMRIIEKNNLLNDFETNEQKIICQAVWWHNKPALPKGRSQRESFFSKLIRDADKLDILQISVNRKSADLKEGIIGTTRLIEEVSEPIFTDLMQGKNVDYGQLKNETDLLMSRIGWVFDLNFPASIDLFCQRKYFDFYSSLLPSTPNVNRVLAKVRAYLASLR